VQNKRKLYIIGASHLGRELESWLELIPAGQREWELAGFLHSFDNKSPLEGYPTDYSILGSWEDYPLTTSDCCIISVADCKWKEKIFLHLKGKVSFFTYIAPSAIIGKFTTIGEGSFICPNSTISTNVKLGNSVFINVGSQIGHDVTIGDYSSLMANVDLGGHVILGKSVFIGSKATIIPKITVEDSSTVGAGSVVIKKVKSGTTVFGNPAKEL
jgi:sugar O-acyltransferase (sialic acid O-acetyltransferase NeuD family)